MFGKFRENYIEGMLTMNSISNKTSLSREYMDQENWYVLYTRPNSEKRINLKLREFGLLSYLPLQKELRHWNDRKVWIETPLFKSYVFIKANLKEKEKAYKVKGILNFVRVGSKLAVLSEEEIERIKKLCSYEGKITIEFENLEVGKQVEIREGVLKGLTGLLTEVNDNRKVRITIKGLNCFASVAVDFDSISLKYIS